MQEDPQKISKKMRELFDNVSNADDLLALSPQELAGKLILILRKLDEPLDPVQVISKIPFSAPQLGINDGYPVKRQHEISEALKGAFNWLEENYLIEQSGKYPKHRELRVLSREAKKIRNEDGFKKLMIWRTVNEDILHPKIAKKALNHLIRGEHADAIGLAMKKVEIAVREAGGFGTDKFGARLMREAFGEGGPLRDSSANRNEEDGLKLLFEGAFGVFRNPHAHRDVPIEDITEALTLVLFASHLLRIVDSRVPPK